MTAIRRGPSERGSALIIVILIMAFLVAAGISLLTITGTGPAVSTNIRTQEEAFNSAEAGFDAAYEVINTLLVDGAWDNFDGHCLTEPAGIDQAASDLFFRKKTDEEVLALLDPGADGTADSANVLFFRQTYAKTPAGLIDPRFAYTVFIINDEAMGGVYDPQDVLLICIGTSSQGGRLTTSRLEIAIAIE